MAEPAPGVAPRTLLLVRHGRTAWNAEGRAQGHADIPMDEEGCLQAKGLAQALSGRPCVGLWSSDLVRAAATATELAAELGVEVRHDDRLREFHVGERQGLTAAEYAERFPHEPDAMVGYLGAPTPIGAEEIEDVRARMSAALSEVLDQLADGETGIVVTHGAALRIALLDLLGWPMEQVSNLAPVRNCHWAEVAVDDVGRAVLVSYNTSA